MDGKCEKRYTLATRDVRLDSFLVTGVIIALMIVWACLTDDKRLLFIPLFFLAVCVVIMGVLLFWSFTEPKIAIQADTIGFRYIFAPLACSRLPYLHNIPSAPIPFKKQKSR